MTDVQPQESPKVQPTTAFLTCPKCGRSNSEGTRYCIICGASLAGVVRAAAEKPTEERQPRGFFAKLFGRR